MNNFDTITARQARRQAADILTRHGLTAATITRAHSVSFQDLARCSRVFVSVAFPTVDGYTLTAPFDWSAWKAANNDAAAAGFYLETERSYTHPKTEATPAQVQR